MIDNVELKTTGINNRRYLGNKYKLLEFINRVVKYNCKNVNTFVDLFAGTGAVSSAFKDKHLITNDLLYSNYICNYAWFSPQQFNAYKIKKLLKEYNSKDINEKNYMSKNFGDTFFSYKDCAKIGYIREDIEQKFKNKKINKRERAILICSLLYAMDKIANTVGHYDAYFKKAKFSKHLTLCYPDVYTTNKKDNNCYNVDSNKLVKKIKADLIYIDPPYNSRQYCDAYHLLENVARWEKPKVFGTAKKMNRDKLKSRYCSKKAYEAFNDLIKNANAKYILLSYNNMADKGNDRSNARISDIQILNVLKAKGDVHIFSEDYKAFTTGKSNHKDNKERLFLCVCGANK